ncbi:MAG: hypothetical protein KAI47_16530 [Deltaproteobacteria bacterium]|nr:hypothetical protein [Deltaproteobacteria bacterium]
MIYERDIALPGLRRAAADAILAHQPRTVAQAIQLPDVGRKIARVLLEAGLITDPEDAMHRSSHNITAATAQSTTTKERKRTDT